MTATATRRTARTGGGDGTGVAAVLAEAAAPLVGGDLPVRLRAWDGSEAGPVGAPLVELRSPDALRRLLWHPGELGAAQAYVTGELEVHGDLGEALTHAFAVGRERGLTGRPSAAAFARAVRTLGSSLGSLGVIGTPLPPPATQAHVRGRRHSLRRDRRAISHHYDLSNHFYALLLGPSMAYSCAYYGDDPDQTVESAQRAKLDLVCRKLDLAPGSRMLDVGCGWGSLSLHAAEQFGAQVVGVTIAAEQKRFIDARIRERGLESRVEIRLQDYREVVSTGQTDEGTFDAVGSLEMGEHVGERNYATYVDVLRRAVRPGGRVLVQQMSRTGRHPGGGPFIESFIAPDMYMRPVGETVAHLERGGLEVRDVHALREHYVRTVAGWLENFDLHLPELTRLIGEEGVRVWRLYLVGGALAFRDGRMGVDQILCVRPGAAHTLPAERAW
ncbi:MAG TPA: cyclopropane-fatty-acyl-phospholipid synthase family protein [Nocardioides sp.]|jgi:cyclopropane-fatty-acyl-phospholipid synthase|nr:cyclopropane-fatty-acyl-phospholipid synthase family protein [Nocardioides sp.]